MTLWLFPGQPLQREQLPPDEDAAAIVQLCRERCSYDLLTDQPLADIPLSRHTRLQVFGVALSLYRARRLRAEGIQPGLIAEHSLGIYAALAAGGSICEGDALELAHRIGAAMADAFRDREYALGCPIGLTADPVEAAARNNGVWVANYNTSRHFLLAGEKAGVEAALAECQAAGAFSVSSFDCEAPLHTPLMAELKGQLAAIVADYRFAEPAVPLMEHISQSFLTAADIPPFLVDELQQPVFWERTWKRLGSLGFSRSVEVGSGRALTKFNRWIDSENC